jgi:hypothetical protein
MLKHALKDKVVCIFFMANVLLSLASCASVRSVPLTPDLIAELGVENMEQYAYYVSKDVKLVRKDTKTGEIIYIDTKTRGAETARAYVQAAFINYQAVGIEFEANTDAQVGFAADLRNPEGRFEIQFDDDGTKTLQYGGHDYSVRYTGDARPYLKVRVTTKKVFK